MKTRTQKIVMTSLFAALCCVATMIIKIPTPPMGYVNLGDCAVLLSGWLLSPMYGFVAAGIGSALADVFSGYIIYAPATFLIKGIMALVVNYGFKILSKGISETIKRVLCGIVAELLMMVGYFVFEGFLYGFGVSAINILANAAQAIAGLVLGIILIKVISNKVSKMK